MRCLIHPKPYWGNGLRDAVTTRHETQRQPVLPGDNIRVQDSPQVGRGVLTLKKGGVARKVRLNEPPNRGILLARLVCETTVVEVN